MSEILIKYYSARMLATLDMNQLFGCLFGRFGECRIGFAPMTTEERARASTQVAHGIEAVNERYWIFHRVGDDFVRQENLEETIVRLGQK